ncbi:MAG: glycosyltransferase family 2 protein [Thermoleophilia bacterium]
MTGPLVSIVTPSYNQARFLEETIRSVLDQDYPELEYLVVDGGSTDGSAEIVERYTDRLAWWTSEPDRGQAAALNKAFAHAAGDVLGWISSDDTLLPGAVSRVVAELERDPGAALVYGEALFVDEEGEELFPLQPRPFDVAAMVRACDNHVVQPGSLFRRDALELAGPFDERAYYFFDFEFVLRLAERGARVVSIPDRLSTYRVHPESKSGGAPLAKARDYVRIADEFLAASALPCADQGRATAYLRAGEYFYEALELGEARRSLLRAARRRPTGRGLSLLAKSFMPRRAVSALRRRRRGGPARD